MTASLDDTMIDAYTIAIEQDVTDEDRVPHDLSADIIANLAGLTTEARQEAVIRIAGDLAFAFNGVVMAGKEEVEARRAEQARLEQERIEREVAESRARVAPRREEIEAQRVRDRQSMADRFPGVAPACGFPNCRQVECYAGTYARRLDAMNSPLTDMTRAFDTLRESAQATSYAWDGWRNLGYTEEALTVEPQRYISAPTMDPEALADWERELLRPTSEPWIPLSGWMFTAPVDTPVQPIEDPVLGTGL